MEPDAADSWADPSLRSCEIFAKLNWYDLQIRELDVSWGRRMPVDTGETWDPLSPSDVLFVMHVFVGEQAWRDERQLGRGV